MIEKSASEIMIKEFLMQNTKLKRVMKEKYA